MASADTPSISIVMALRDKESTVRRAIGSVLAQTFQDFELIIVDDGSVDRGPETVQSYRDNRIRMILEQGRGAGAARNRGITQASADLIAFLDADDEYHPNFVEIALGMKERYPEADAFYQTYEVVERDGSRNVVKSILEGKEIEDGIVERYFHLISEGGVPMTSSSVVIKSSILHALGGFKTGVWYGEDTDLWGRIALNHKVAFSRNVGAIVHRDAPNRLSDKRDNPGEHVLISELEQALREKRYGLHNCEDIEEYIVKLRFSLVYRCLIAGDSKGARDILKNTRTRRYRNERFKWWLWTLIPYRLFLRFH